MISPQVQAGAASTRTEQEVRRKRAIKTVREAARRDGQDPDEAEYALRCTFITNDLVRMVRRAVDAPL